MNRLKKFIKGMSLTQQLMSVVLVSLAFFIFFLLVFIFGNINTLVSEQLFSSIDGTQQRVINNYKNSTNLDDVFIGTDPNVIHIIYSLDDNRAVITNATTTLDVELDRIFRANFKNQTTDLVRYENNDTDLSVVYQIRRIDLASYIVSFVPNSYMDQFKLALVNGVVNILLVIVGILFLLLMIWVGYLIHSLKQIEIYINKYRKGEDVDLKMERSDEVGELARAIVGMNQEIRRQEQLKEEMVQNISHDLKTPIATIKSYGESIKDGIYPYETLEKSVDVIIEHANRLEKKVHSLLLLNRMGYLIAEDKGTDKTEMKDVIEKVLLSLKVIKPAIKLKTDLTSCSYYGSEEPWRVVIENILDNALRYAKSEISIDLKSDYCIIYNDGPTIPENRIEQIFKPYEKGTGGQFGLGLAIVRRVLTAYHYTIRIKNLNIGVQFIIEKEKNDSKITKDEHLTL
jgi:two-component system, OmpR family, sensor histidine kinase CssS